MNEKNQTQWPPQPPSLPEPAHVTKPNTKEISSTDNSGGGDRNKFCNNNPKKKHAPSPVSMQIISKGTRMVRPSKICGEKSLMIMNTRVKLTTRWPAPPHRLVNGNPCDAKIIQLATLLLSLITIISSGAARAIASPDQANQRHVSLLNELMAPFGRLSPSASLIQDSAGSSSSQEFAKIINDLNQTILPLQLSSSSSSTSSGDNNHTTTTKDLNTMLSNISVLADLANGNATESFAFNSETERYILIVNLVAEIAVLAIGIIGNGAVIAIILFFTKGNSVADVYIFNLAIADITFLAGLGFLFITSINDHWVFGNIMCKMFMSLTALNQFASSLLLSLMSFDRYLAVCHPIFSQRYRHPKPAKYICLVLWILCFVLMIPIFIHARTDEDNKTCGIFWPDSGIHERVFTLYSFCLGFLLPLVLIVVFYRCVVVKLKSRTASGSTSMQSERRTKNRETTNKRVSNLVKAIVATYGVCWLPYWIGQMLIGFSDTKSQMTYYTFNQVAACLSYLNSAVNPILYAFLSDSFRRRCSQFWQLVLSFQLFKRLRHQDHQHQPWRPSPATQTSVADNYHPPHHGRHPESNNNNNSTYINDDDDDDDEDDRGGGDHNQHRNMSNSNNKNHHRATTLLDIENGNSTGGHHHRETDTKTSGSVQWPHKSDHMVTSRPTTATSNSVIELGPRNKAEPATVGLVPVPTSTAEFKKKKPAKKLLSIERLKFRRRKKTQQHSLVKLNQMNNKCAATNGGALLGQSVLST